MRKLALLIIVFLSAMTASARTWTLKNGETISGDFHRIENKWVVVITEDGSKRPINISHLDKKDRAYARNLAAILGNKPPEVEATDPAKRVQIQPNKPKPPEKKPAITLNPEPETVAPPEANIEEPEPENTEPETTVDPASVEKPNERTVSEKQPEKKPEKPKTIAKKPEPKPDTAVQKKNRIKNTIRRSKLIILADALDNSIKRNKNATIYFLVLCLLVLIHKMHMPHLYKTEFRPGTSQPKGSIKKEFDKDDDRERYRTCPFCKLTNPTSAEQCQHCGQYLK